jgi:hypothetical protein
MVENNRSNAWLAHKHQEIQQLMARFQAAEPTGVAVQQLEVLVRTAIFQPAVALVGYLLQDDADRIDASYQPKLGERRMGREPLTLQGVFGFSELKRAIITIMKAKNRDIIRPMPPLAWTGARLPPWPG